MFSDETNELIQDALDHRELVVTARQEAKSKTAARAAAAEEESKAIQSLGSINTSANEARQKAMDAVAGELAVPQEVNAEPKVTPPLGRAARGLPAMAGR